MSVYVFGGSNSLLKKGWTHYLRQHIPDLKNKSIGASSSAMGLYRLITTPNVSPDDLLIWEYGINDYSMLRREQLPLDYVLAFAEHFLIKAREKNARVLPVLMRTAKVEQGEQSADYVEAILALFRAYELTPVDANAAVRTVLGKERIPPNCFLDDLHLKTKPRFMNAIVSSILAQQEGARTPSACEPIYTQGRRAEFLHVPGTVAFKNAILDVTGSYGPTKHSISSAAKVMSPIFLTAKQNGRVIFSVTSSGGEVRKRGKPAHKSKAKRLLTAGHLPSMGTPLWKTSGPSVFAIENKHRTLPLRRKVRVFLRTRRWPQEADHKAIFFGVLVALEP